MKIKHTTLFLLMGLFVLNTWTVKSQVEKDNIKVPKEYKLTSKIYHKGWIDFNKNGKMDVYEDPSQAIEDRINDLLSQMTVNEKTCQMVTLYGYKRVLKDALPTPEWKNEIWKDGIANIDEHLNGFQQWGKPASTNPNVWPASRHAWALNEVQKFFIEDTRLGIPVDFTNEGIRGVESYMATDFPTQLGLGHTWDRELIHEVGYITGREGRLLGYTNVYAPILDVGRDQRWGRYEEVYGESPYLVAELGIQMVKGMQTNHQVAATAKHFLAYSNNKGAREGLARCDPQMSPREIENIHAYTFKRVIQEAGLLGVMSSYNDYDGLPIQSSHYWLTTRLRGEMGFKGYVISDSDALEYLFSKHHTAKDMKEAVRQSIEAGLNVRCTFRTPESFLIPLRELIQEGGISMATIDDRVRDVLRVKFMVGLFDAPYQTDLQVADQEVNSLKNQAVALRASRECLVLLKNNKELLPLDASQLKTISVCGPNANAKKFALTHYGPLAVPVTSVLEGIQSQVASGTEVLYTKGCDIVDPHWPESEIIPYDLNELEQQEIAKAVENAKKSDVAVVVLGGGPRTAGENKSRSSIDLPGHQEALLQAVVATGKPVVLVLINGRPLSINWADRYVPAILEAWYPGSQGGTAIAEALFGKYNPGGKLTVTFPKTVGQIPLNFPAKPSSQVNGTQGLGMDGKQTRVNDPLYSFGYGLSYTTFEYSDIQIDHSSITPLQSVEVSCKVTNTGKRAGDEVVQLYVRDVLSSVTTYEKSLRGFDRVHLAPGETKEVHFTIYPRDLQLYNAHNEWVVEPGDFKIMIGASSQDIRLNTVLTVVPIGELNTASTAPTKNSEKPWTGKQGAYVTFPLVENSSPTVAALAWSEKSSDATFDIQLSGGGGQFLTVYSGKVEASNELKNYKFKSATASDIRILITSGTATLSKIKLRELKE